MTHEVRSRLIEDGSKAESEGKAKLSFAAECKAKLIDGNPPGEYVADNGRRAQIIKPDATINPSQAAIDAAREIIADETLFRKLFVKGLWKAVKDFRSVCAAVLSKPKAAKVIATCETEAAAYVLFK